MALKRLEFGDSIAGLLFDGVSEPRYTGATVLMRASGVVVEVPYVRAAQFEHVQRWFRMQDPPAALQIVTHDGTISLFEVRWNGYRETTGRRSSIGELRPREAVLHPREGALGDPLTIDVVRSRLDGLNHWIRESSAKQRRHDDADGRLQKLDIEIERVVAAEWMQGDAAMTLQTDWRVEEKEDLYDRGSLITDHFVLETKFSDGPRPFEDHLTEQRKVANLLVFMYGSTIAFREHKVKDDRFAERYGGSGEIYNYPFVELISTSTVRERSHPILSRDQLGYPLAFLANIGPDGLRAWAAEYEKWERFILPSVSALGRAEAFAEEVVMSTSISLEVAGELFRKQLGEKATYSGSGNPTVATNIYRCLRVLGIGWGAYVASDVGLAIAIANNYNGVKHFDNKKRLRLPAGEETLLVSEINSLVVRLLALRITGAADSVLARYRAGENLWPIQQQFDRYGIRVLADGSWGPTQSK